MQKLVPHLWYDQEAVAAAELYTSVFPDSAVKKVNRITDTPSGDCDIVSFNLWGVEFQAISAGPYFRFNPSISLSVMCDSPKQVDAIHDKLREGGSDLMPLGEYPFSPRYAWISDKYGLNWQILYMPDVRAKVRIVPTLMFVGDLFGRAEEAINFWVDVFKGEVHSLSHYEEVNEYSSERELGKLKYAAFTLLDTRMAVQESGMEGHHFAFNEAISFIVNCQDQAEIDYYWEKLSTVPEAEQCGWCKDQFGVSWQIVPAAMERMIEESPETAARVTQAFLKMKKFDVAELEKAAKGE